jgi:hypothetical protein
MSLVERWDPSESQHDKFIDPADNVRRAAFPGSRDVFHLCHCRLGALWSPATQPVSNGPVAGNHLEQELPPSQRSLRPIPHDSFARGGARIPLLSRRCVMSTKKVVPVPLTPTERHKLVALGVKAGKSNRAIREKSWVSTREQSGETENSSQRRKLSAPCRDPRSRRSPGRKTGS